MLAEVRTPIERVFLALPEAERETIIRHGVALRMCDLRKRLFLAESKLRQFEERYGAALTHLDQAGLPDDAGYEMHEDYIAWHHWTTVARKATQETAALLSIALQGLWQGEQPHAG